ncbi:hypothetical protein WDJ51_08700 [Rathayibacter sp. YIM 133350]|uniref:hypothetical protein n=1 Tax=Rathayibacter sp. YIM 133350 TaxID=3131992 RepID=UPI00307E86B9
MKLRHLLMPLCATAVAVALSGCSGAPSPASTEDQPGGAEGGRPTPANIADPIAFQPLAGVTGIVVRPDHLDLNDHDGATVLQLPYDTDAARFVAVLTAVLGAEPTVTEHEGGMESWPTTRYDWEGVQVLDDHEEKGPIDLNLNIRFSRPAVGDDVVVSTIQGFQAGDDPEEFADELGEDWDDDVVLFAAETGPEVAPREFDDYPNAWSVTVTDSDDAPADADYASAIFAPWNFGVGHV